MMCALQVGRPGPGYTESFKRAIGVALLVTAQFANAQGTSAMLSASLVTRYPAGTILTAEMANLALAQVLAVRTQIESQFAMEEQACYPTFFASSCLEDTKERRHAALARIRPVEIEANTFNRRMRVLERDNALAEKHAVLAAQAPQRAQDQQLKGAETAQKVLDSAQKLKAQQDASDVNAANAGKRVEEHAANLRRWQAEQVADAPGRAANVAAYVQKTKDAEARQREVAASKMEKAPTRVVRQAPLLPDVAKDSLRQPSGSSLSN